MNFKQIFENAQKDFNIMDTAPMYMGAVNDITSNNLGTKNQDRIRGVSTAAIGAGLSFTPLAPIAPVLAPLAGNFISKIGQEADKRAYDKERILNSSKIAEQMGTNNYKNAINNTMPQLEYYKLGGTPYGNYEVEDSEIVLGDANIPNSKEIAKGVHKVEGKTHEEGGEMGKGGHAVITDTLIASDILISTLNENGIKAKKGATYAELAELVGKKLNLVEKEKEYTTDVFRNKTIESKKAKLDNIMGLIMQEQEVIKTQMGSPENPENNNQIPKYELGVVDNTVTYDALNLGAFLNNNRLINKTPKAVKFNVPAPVYNKPVITPTGELDAGYATGLNSIDSTTSFNKNANKAAMLINYLTTKSGVALNNTNEIIRTNNLNNSISNKFRSDVALADFNNTLAENTRTGFMLGQKQNALNTALMGILQNRQVTTQRKTDLLKTILNTVAAAGGREGVKEDIEEILVKSGLYRSLNW